jgi:hypothetical protein
MGFPSEVGPGDTESTQSARNLADVAASDFGAMLRVSASNAVALDAF